VDFNNFQIVHFTFKINFLLTTSQAWFVAGKTLHMKISNILRFLTRFHNSFNLFRHVSHFFILNLPFLEINIDYVKYSSSLWKSIPQSHLIKQHLQNRVTKISCCSICTVWNSSHNILPIFPAAFWLFGFRARLDALLNLAPLRLPLFGCWCCTCIEFMWWACAFTTWPTTINIIVLECPKRLSAKIKCLQAKYLTSQYYSLSVLTFVG